MRKQPAPRNFVGEKYGRLTIISFSGYTENTVNRTGRWLCRCDCGNETVVQRGALTSGNTKSCGCYASEKTIERNRNHLTEIDSVAFNNLYRAYRAGANKRGKEFSLDKERFKAITKGACYFCGTEPCQVMKSKFGESYVYNGVDRLDNTQGYVNNNVVSCCGICNYAKNNLPLDVFEDWITRLVNYQTIFKTRRSASKPPSRWREFQRPNSEVE